MNKMILLAVLLTLCGCSTTLGKYEHATSNIDGEIIFYRDWTFLKGAVDAVVYIDSIPIVKIGNNEYVAIPISIGKHVIGVNGDSYAGENFHFDIVIENNSRHYYEISPDSSQWLISLAPPMAQVGTSPFVTTVSDENSFNSEKTDMDKMTIEGL